MEKIHYQDDHQDVIAAAGGYRFALIEHKDAMTKSASEAISREDVQRHKPDDKHFGLHLVAMGSDESVGPNRNGDGWPEKALKEYHPTFVKMGCFFREHANRCQKTEGIGIIKHAAYNPTMNRVELIVWGDKRKAEEEYEMAKQGSELSFSMSARMPYDRCSICGNKARTQKKYCRHLKKGSMLRFNDEMQKYAYAINDTDLKFFDISRVKTPADRIAHYIRYTFANDDEMRKAASADDFVITGADWAAFEGVNLGGDDIRQFTPWEEGTLRKLAAAERMFGAMTPEMQELAKQASPRPLTDDAVKLFRTKDFALLSGELVKKAMVLDFASFAALLTGEKIDDLLKSASFAGAAESCGTMFADMEAQGGCGCGDAAELVTPDPFGLSLDSNKDPIDRMIKDIGENLGMEQGAVEKRAFHNPETVMLKKASVAPSAEVDPFYAGLVQTYGYYLVKAAHQLLDAKGVAEHLLVNILPAMNRSLI